MDRKGCWHTQTIFGALGKKQFMPGLSHILSWFSHLAQSHSWRDATLPSPPPCYPMTLREILIRHVLHVVACPSLFHYREARMSGLFIPYLERRVRFPAIKTHSVPNLLARSSASGEQPIKTEKSNSAGARINRDSRNKRWRQSLLKAHRLQDSLQFVHPVR